MKDYAKECQRQLNNTENYKHLQKDRSATKDELVYNIIKRFEKEELSRKSSQKNSKWALCKLPNFYTQPKVHKDVNQGRSVSSLNCHTTKISEHIDDYHLQPIFQQIPSYVTDTCGFISKLKAAETVPDNSYLVLLNVKSLYTSIPNSEGIEAVKI